MSHIVRVKNVEMVDQTAREMAVQRMENANYVDVNGNVVQSEAEAIGSHPMYGRQKAEGIGIKFDGWAHPVVIKANDGAAQFDSYGCQRGTQHAIDELVAYYATEKAKIDAQLKGISLQEVETEDEIKLVAMMD